MENQNNFGIRSRLPFHKRLLISFLRVFFRLLYHQLAWGYDWIAAIVSLGAWKNWVKSVASYLNGPRVLEIGFGPGHLQSALLNKEISAYGVDESKQMVRIAHHRLINGRHRPLLIRGDAGHLPFASTSFDQVVMTFPAEFLLKSNTFSEIDRILIKGGNAFILPMAWITGRSPLERAAAWLNRVTGETPVWDEKYLEPIKKLGFDVHWEMMTFSSSKALLIRLTKPHISR